MLYKIDKNPLWNVFLNILLVYSAVLFTLAHVSGSSTTVANRRYVCLQICLPFLALPLPLVLDNAFRCYFYFILF